MTDTIEKLLNTFENACYRFALQPEEGHKKQVADLEKEILAHFKKEKLAIVASVPVEPCIDPLCESGNECCPCSLGQWKVQKAKLITESEC